MNIIALPVSFFAEGIPKAQPRPRAFSRKFGDKWSSRMYDPGTSDGWKQSVKNAAKHLAGQKYTGALRIDISFYMPRPKYMMSKKFSDFEIWHDVKPDRDNLEKAVLDALKDIDVLDDDCKVVDGRLRKMYVRKSNGTTGAYLHIRQLDPIESYQACLPIS